MFLKCFIFQANWRNTPKRIFSSWQGTFFLPWSQFQMTCQIIHQQTSIQTWIKVPRQGPLKTRRCSPYIVCHCGLTNFNPSSLASIKPESVWASRTENFSLSKFLSVFLITPPLTEVGCWCRKKASAFSTCHLSLCDIYHPPLVDLHENTLITIT